MNRPSMKLQQDLYNCKSSEERLVLWFTHEGGYKNINAIEALRFLSIVNLPSQIRHIKEKMNATVETVSTTKLNQFHEKAKYTHWVFHGILS